MGPGQQHNPKKDYAHLLLGPFTSLDTVGNIGYANLPVYFLNGWVLLLPHVVILSILSSPCLSCLLIGLFTLSLFFPPVPLHVSVTCTEKAPSFIVHICTNSFVPLRSFLSDRPTARGRQSALGSIHMKLQICFWVSWLSLQVFCHEIPWIYSLLRHLCSDSLNVLKYREPSSLYQMNMNRYPSHLLMRKTSPFQKSCSILQFVLSDPCLSHCCFFKSLTQKSFPQQSKRHSPLTG